jgi:hypothetical protein
MLFVLDNQWSLDLIVKNVFDEKCTSFNAPAIGAQAPLPPLAAVRGQPQQYIVQFTFRP